MKNLNLVCRHTMYNSLRQLTYLAFPSHLLVRELLPSTCYVHSSVLYTGRQAGRQVGPYSQCARSALQTHDRPLLSRARDCTASGTVAVDEVQALGPCLRAMGWRYSLMEGWRGKAANIWNAPAGKQVMADNLQPGQKTGPATYS